MSSTKSATGHLLGAAGAIEFIFSLLAIRDQVVPPTINLDNRDADTKINLCANTKVEAEINIVLSNSFGFGGTNACLIMGKL
jgi:3-oxoacyl-[acyl-carrier-protein] synthase II